MQYDINKIINKYNTDIIETALIQLFIDIKKVSVKRNSLIKSILNNKSKESSTVKTFLSSSIKIKNLYDLINIFEMLIPATDKKVNGAFFTPPAISNFITKQTLNNSEQKICDPSCGCGAFLIAAAELIHKEFKKPIVNIIEENLYGVDIFDYNVNRVKIIMTLLAIENKEDIEEIKFNIKPADSLKINWESVFGKIKFDIVIGNPPYVKYQDLNNEKRADLYNNWNTLKTGNYNLYFAFFELGINIMKEDGILSYITPNNYFTSLAGIKLREFLTSNKLIERIVDFNHLKIFESQTYTCITFLRKHKKDFFQYERIEDYDILNSLDKLNYSKIFFNNINNKKWRLIRELDQNNIKKIENMEFRLGDLADIRTGIATCKDSIYFIDGLTLENNYYKKQYRDNIYSIEKEATKAIFKISDFKNQRDIAKNNRRIIFPYKKNNGKVELINKNELKNIYPKCYAYLSAAKNELDSRDKGRIIYPEWYAYARTQGLNFFGEKLLTPTFSAEPRFLLETSKDYNEPINLNRTFKFLIP